MFFDPFMQCGTDHSIFLVYLRDAILKKWIRKCESDIIIKRKKDMENGKYTEEFKQSIVSLYESGKSTTRGNC